MIETQKASKQANKQIHKQANNQDNLLIARFIANIKDSHDYTCIYFAYENLQNTSYITNWYILWCIKKQHISTPNDILNIHKLYQYTLSVTSLL